MARFSLWLIFLLILSETSNAQNLTLFPALPACERAVEHADRDFTVFFTPHSDVLSDRGKRVAHELASIFARDNGYIVALGGHIDGAEATRPGDVHLGLRRAGVVAAMLMRAGMHSAQIYTKDFGSSAPLVEQPPGTGLDLNRRVHVTSILGTDEDRAAKMRRCKAAIQTTCFETLISEQRTLCEHSLNILSPTD